MEACCTPYATSAHTKDPALALTSGQVLDDLVQRVQDAALGLKRDPGFSKQLKDVAPRLGDTAVISRELNGIDGLLQAEQDHLQLCNVLQLHVQP